MIKAFPDIDLRALKRRDPQDPFLEDPGFYLYGSGRAAVFAAARLLRSRRHRTVHMPSFHCGVEIEGFARAGFNIRFYPVDRSLRVDVHRLAERGQDPGDVVFVTHYFGFPQPMAELASFCAENDLILVEDCAHSLYGKAEGRHLGRFGHLSVFSMRKTVALPNGGGLLINDSRLGVPEPGRSHWVPTLIRGALRSALEFERRHESAFELPAKAILGTYEKLTRARKESEFPGLDEQPDFYDDPRFGFELALSRLSRALLHPMPEDRIRNIRRRNYGMLSSQLTSCTDLREVFPALEEGTVPLCLPIWVDSSDRWMTQLLALNVEAFVFGRFPHPSLPEDLSQTGEALRKRVLGLPIQQDLTETDIYDLAERICESQRGTAGR